MITKTENLTYKLKDVNFQDGHLVDENGEIIDLMLHLKTVFGDTVFELVAKSTNKQDLEISNLLGVDGE